MSLTTPGVSNASLSMTVAEAVASPLTQTTSIKLPLSFTNVANLKVISGTYTPNNDTTNPGGTFYNNIPTAQSPNFLLLICDGQINLTVSTNGNASLVDAPVQRVAFFTFTQSAAADVIQILFDGHSNVPAPMAQGTPVNYTLVIGQATIT